MAEDAFKQFAKMELVKVCEPLYIFYYQYLIGPYEKFPLVHSFRNASSGYCFAKF